MVSNANEASIALKRAFCRCQRPSSPRDEPEVVERILAHNEDPYTLVEDPTTRIIIPARRFLIYSSLFAHSAASSALLYFNRRPMATF